MALRIKSNGDIRATLFTESEDPKVGSSPLDYTVWVEGGDSATGFSRNGDVAENEIISADGPFGQTLVWYTKPSGNSNGDGGWNTSTFAVDETKMYRFSVWVRNTGTENSGNYYHGLHGYPDPVLAIGNSVANSNPYFDCPGVGSIPSEWTLSVGHVFPSGTVTTTTHPDTGRWSLAGVKLSTGGCNLSGVDCKWAPGTTSANERVYHYYSTSTNSHLQFAFPRVEVCDGTEPTIEQLLNNYEVRLGSITRVGDLDETTGVTGAAHRIKRDGTLMINGEFIEE